MNPILASVPNLWQTLTQISAREIEKHVRAISALGPRPDGSAANQAAALYLVQNFKALDLAVHRLPLQFQVLEDLETGLAILAPDEWAVPCEGHLRTGLTSEAGITAPLVHVGKAFREDLSDVEGKIVLAYEEIPFEGNGPSGIRYFGERVQDAHAAGAVGFVFADYRPDDLIMTWGVMRDLAPIPCVAISYPSYCTLRDRVAREPVRACLKVTARVSSAPSDTISAGPEGPGDRPLIILLGTHYETVPTCTGANDNASSLAILLELARVFNGMPLDADLLYIATSGEEAGSFGAIEYAEKHRAWLEQRTVAVIGFDQVGGMDVPLSANGTPELNRLFIESADALGFKLRVDNDPECPLRTGLSDVQPFCELGIPSVYLGGWASDLFYHTRADTPDKLNPNALKVLAEIIALTVLRLSHMKAV